MKRKILVTVSYVMDAEEDMFWDRSSGWLQDSVDKHLKRRFPKKIRLPNEIRAGQYLLSHQIIDNPKKNYLTCPVCKRPLTNPAEPNPILELDQCVTVEGVEMCKSCAWQLDMEIKTHGIKSVLERYKDRIF